MMHALVRPWQQPGARAAQRHAAGACRRSRDMHHRAGAVEPSASERKVDKAEVWDPKEVMPMIPAPVWHWQLPGARAAQRLATLARPRSQDSRHHAGAPEPSVSEWQLDKAEARNTLRSSLSATP